MRRITMLLITIMGILNLGISYAADNSLARADYRAGDAKQMTFKPMRPMLEQARLADAAKKPMQKHVGMKRAAASHKAVRVRLSK